METSLLSQSNKQPQSSKLQFTYSMCTMLISLLRCVDKQKQWQDTGDYKVPTQAVMLLSQNLFLAPRLSSSSGPPASESPRHSHSLNFSVMLFLHHALLVEPSRDEKAEYHNCSRRGD